MDSHVDSQQLVVVDDSDHYLTMPQEDFVDLYCQPIMDDTWIRTQDIVHMSDLVETEGGEKIKKEILHEHIQERTKSGQYRQDPVLEGMLWQEQFMEDYQQSGERQQDTEQAMSYRERILAQYRARHPTRRGSTADAIEAVLSPSKRAVGTGAAAAPHDPPKTHTTSSAAAPPSAYPSESASPIAAAHPEDKTGVHTAADGDGATVTAAVPDSPPTPDIRNAQYTELAGPPHSSPASPSAANRQPVPLKTSPSMTQDEHEAVESPDRLSTYPTEGADAEDPYAEL